MFLFPYSENIGPKNTYILSKSIPNSVHTIAEAVNAMWQCYSTVFGFESNPHSYPSFLFTRVKLNFLISALKFKFAIFTNFTAQSPFEKLTVLQVVKKLPIFYGTWKFITGFIGVHHLSLSRGR
jgi:hypothetical protein